MKFDFETPPDRHFTDSQKWQKYQGKDILPMWVADMDFRCPPPVLAALHQRVDEDVFGYARPTQSTTDAVLDYFQNQYNWKIEKEWILWLPGLGVGLNAVSRTIGNPGDGVITPTPIYPPFLLAPQWADRELITSDLVLEENSWEIDWDAMEKAIKPNTKLFLLCNPHNPVAKVWRRHDLEKVADFCLKHDLVLCSDEVHCDLILDDIEFTPTALISEEIHDRTITFHAPSKTFNIAGLACALAIIPDSKLRFSFARTCRGIVSEVSNLGYAACAAAYRHGEPWRQELLQILRLNRDLLLQFVKDELPGIKATPIEATYLAWLKTEELHLDDPIAFFEKGGVGLSDGRFFGDARYVRLNFGCPQVTLVEGLRRMKKSLNTL